MNQLRHHPFFYPALALLAFAVTACDDPESESPNRGKYSSGVFITNEGAFGRVNGEVSFFNPDTDSVTNDLFQTVNGRTLGGDVVQSMFVHDERAYVVCNNSNKVEVADANTFMSTGVIGNLTSPRYMVAAGNTGYVSEWAGPSFPVSAVVAGRIAVVDLATNSVTKTIAVGKLPEQLRIAGNALYVTNSGENTVSVIDLTSETVTDTLTIGDSPNSIVADRAGNLWVLCGGNIVYNADFTDTVSFSNAQLVRLDVDALDQPLVFPFNAPGAEDLTIDKTGDKLYYSSNGVVYELPVDATTLTPRIVVRRSFYGIGVHDDALYGADASGFTSEGKVIRYDIATGAAVDSFAVGIGPNGFWFR